MDSTKTETIKLNRNNTDFPIELFEILKKQPIGTDPKYAFLKYWQDLCRLFVTKVDIGSRGLLVQHQMGFGKSILAIALSVELLETGKTMIILAKSLQGNMRDQIKKYVFLRGQHDPDFAPGKMSPAALEAWITEHFSFVSLNAGNMMTQVTTCVNQQSEIDAALESRLGRIVDHAVSLDGLNIVVDEAHHLFRMISNGSKNGLAFYDSAKKSDAKMFFLTGTPVASDPFEVVPCFNLLSGTPFSLFPETYEEFNRLFVDPTSKQLANKGKYQNRIMGLVTSISIYDEIGANAIHATQTAEVIADLRAKFPVEFPLIVRKVHMTQEQWVLYQLARENEAEESKRSSGDKFGFKVSADAPRAHSARMTKPKSHAASTYKVKSRQLSNFCAASQQKERNPSMINDPSSPKFDAMYEEINSRPNQLGIVYSQFIGVGGLGVFARFLETKGWVAANYLGVYTEEEAVEIPTAQEEVVEIPSAQEEPAVTVQGGDTNSEYSFFDVIPDAPTYGGSQWDPYPTLDDHMSALEGDNPWTLHPPPSYGGYTGGCECGCNDPDCMCECKGKTPCVCGVNCTCSCAKSKAGGQERVLRFAILTGAVKIEERERIIAQFVSTDNIRGELIALLLVSATGAEGLDLKCLRYLIMMEPYWVWNRFAQFFARGPRIGSHDLLPTEERNCQPLLFLSIPPKSESSMVDNNEIYVETTDTELYKEACVNRDAVASFVGANKEVSIECMMNGGDCRVCTPTGQPLFTEDPDSDVRRADPCVRYQPVMITAQQIEYNHATYYWVQSTGPLGYDIFEFDNKLGSHKKIAENSALFSTLVKLINPDSFAELTDIIENIPGKIDEPPK